VGWLRRIALDGASMSHQGIKTGFLSLAERTSSDSVLRPEGIIDTPVFFLEALMVLTGSIAFDDSLPKLTILAKHIAEMVKRILHCHCKASKGSIFTFV